MIWGSVAVAAVGAYSAYDKKKQAKKQAKAGQGSGAVDLTSEQSPWGPSVDYRTEGMQRTLDMLRSPQGSWSAAQQPPSGGGARRNGAAAPQWWEKFQGAGPETERLLGDLRARGEGGHELYAPANAFTKKLLAGEDPNAYRAETFGALRDFDDPNLRRFTEMLFAGQMPGTAGGSDNGLGTRNSSGRGGVGGGGGAGSGPIGIEKYIKEILDGKYLDQENPGLAGMIDASTRGINQKFMEVDVPGVTSQFTGAGRLGSGAWANALAKSERERATALGDTVGSLRFNDREARMADLMKALSEGNAYDMNAINASATRGAAGAGASAAQYAADKESSDRMALARMGALQDAIGGGIDMRKFSLSGMSGLSDLYGRDQMGALGMVGELSGLDLRDLGTGAELSIGADRNRTDYGLGMGQLDLGRRQMQSANGARNAALNWEREQYNREEPWKRSMQYADIINALSGGGGTTRTTGTDFRNTAYPDMPNPWTEGASAGLANWYANRGDASGYLGDQRGQG